VIVIAAVIVAEMVTMTVVMVAVSVIAMAVMMIVVKTKITHITEVIATGAVKSAGFASAAARLHQISSNGACHDAAPSGKYYDLPEESKELYIVRGGKTTTEINLSLRFSHRSAIRLRYLQPARAFGE